MRKLMVAGCLLITGATAPAPRSLPEFSEPSARPFRADQTAAGFSKFVVMSELPLPAQARIATVLGRDDVEYHAVRRGAGVAVRNADHGLAVDFTKDGIEVRAGTATWRSALRGYGRGQRLRAAAPVMPLAHDNRVEYKRGDLTEWYENGPLGIEQGFTFARPVGDRHGEPLTITLSVSGTLSASVDAAGTSMTMSTSEGGPVLRYRGLTAYDAAGRELCAWMEVEADQLTLRVDDLHAQYPVVVDPFIEQATLAASDGAIIDQFGIAVAIDGDVLVVGALRGDGMTTNTGAAYVFEKPGNGWTGSLIENAKLIASDGTFNASFGSFVAIDGETIAVGTSIGASYVFVRPAGGWSGVLTQDARLTPSECCNNPFTVAISGDTVVSGSPNKDFPGSFEQGAAYVFVKPAAGWTNMTETARLTASDGAGGDFFGTSVAMSGDTIVVGSPQDEPTAGGAADHGSAYVFVKPGAGWSGTLQEVAKLTASDAAIGDLFGRAVAINGPTIAVGAPRKGGLDPGGAYVFELPAGGWSGALTENARLIASDGGGNFGISVAVGGNTVVAGAPLNDNSRGAAYVFLEPPGGWSELRTETQKLVTSNPFWVHGLSVAISGATIVVGQFNNLTIVGDKGSAYVFDGPAADVGVTMSASPDPVVAGSDVTYTITVTNHGPDDAPSVTVTDDLASELTFVSCAATGSGTCAGSGNTRSVTFASLAAGAAETISIVALVNTATADGNTIVNTASVASAATDHNSENDSAATTTSVIQQADLIVTKMASAGPVEAGTNVSYTITVVNSGPNSATAVTLTDSLAAGTTFVSHSPESGSTCVVPSVGTSGTITCSVASLASGAMATFTVEANLGCGVANGLQIANTASVSSSTPDPTAANNSATANVTASNAPPAVTAAIASTVLSSMNEPALVNVGLSASVNDGACAAPTMTVTVYGDEDDQTPISRNEVFSPDAADIGIGTLRLRAERVKNLNGRVYLIVVTAVDAAGAAGFATTTVVVPQKPSPSSLSSVNAQAAAAKSHADAHGGTPPPGFFVIGDGPIIGPLQ